MRKQYEGKSKAKVALKAIIGEKTLSHFAGVLGVRSNQIGRWKGELLLCSHHVPRASEPGSDTPAGRGVHEASIIRFLQVDRLLV
jgi:hypothetical protein